MLAQGRGERATALHADRGQPAVRIEDVEHPLESSGALLASRIDSPRRGSTSSRFAIDLRGWVTVRDSAPAEIQLVCHDEILMSTPIDIERGEAPRRLTNRAGGKPIGFRAEIGAFRLPPRFELAMRVKLASGRTIPLAVIRGRRLSLRAEEPRTGLRPVVISTPTGRTGTSWAVSLLSRNPLLVAQPPVGMEPRPATYWLEAAAALAEPPSYMQSLRPRMQRPNWWLGDWTEAARYPPPEEPLATLLGRENVVRLASFARERVEAFYAAVARDQGKSPTAFVEKAPSGRTRLDVMADVFPGLREIVLVRDPRDTLCSILAYAKRRPNVMLVRENPGTDDEYMHLMARSFEGILRDVEKRRDSALVVRYEDLVLKPEETLPTVLDHLAVDSSDAVVEEMLEGGSEANRRLERHRTAPSVTASVGRWREEMDAELQARAGRAFGEVLGSLGYV